VYDVSEIDNDAGVVKWHHQIFGAVMANLRPSVQDCAC
jgi:hypothetical protein